MKDKQEKKAKDKSEKSKEADQQDPNSTVVKAPQDFKPENEPL
jgi:hypothetical protein